jgi:6-phosphogluconolactonase
LPDASILQTTNGTVKVFVDSAALACALADAFVDIGKAAIAARGRFVVALAGGSTPRAAYGLLAVEPRRSAVDWSCVELFFGDERCVPPDNDESNFLMANETLLSHVAIVPEHLHRMKGEFEPAEAARSYAAEMRTALGETPVFDLVMLGLGPDAHTASWFPEVTIQSNLLVDAPYVPKFSTHRLTLTEPVVNAARNIVVATGGAEKAKALSEVFSGNRNESLYPAQRLAPATGSLTWLIDRAAADGLSSVTRT